MRTVAQLTALLLLMACLAACQRTVPPSTSLAKPPAALPASVTPPAPKPSMAVVNPGLVVAVAQDANDPATDHAADREQTLRVLKRLRDQAREHQRVLDAVQSASNERCLHGQKMRHVANGWEQAGTC